MIEKELLTSLNEKSLSFESGVVSYLYDASELKGNNCWNC